MAACEKIYGNRKQWQEFKEFLLKKDKLWVKEYMRKEPEEGDDHAPICYTFYMQKYLLENCDLAWVKEQIEVNLSIQHGLDVFISQLYINSKQ